MTKFQRYYYKNKDVLNAKDRERYRKSCGNVPRQVLTAEERTKRNRERALAWAKANPGKCAAKTAKRKSVKLQQTPKWANLEEIEEFYNKCPEGFHVDHIIPLQGKNVRGLHVLENLQYLPILENLKKYNKF